MNLDNNKDDLKKLLSEIKIKTTFFSTLRQIEWLASGQNELAIKILENRKIEKDHYPFFI